MIYFYAMWFSNDGLISIFVVTRTFGTSTIMAVVSMAVGAMIIENEAVYG